MKTNNQKRTVLLVDDDRHLLDSMGAWLIEQGFLVSLAGNTEEALRKLNERFHDLALIDLRLGDQDGMDLLRECKKHHPNVVALLMTGYATVDTGVEAIKAGAFDLMSKPLIDDEILIAFDRALSQQQVIEENEQLKTQLDQRFGRDNIVGNDARMQKTFDMVDSIADTKATVLITGESGTGKSLIARQRETKSESLSRLTVEPFFLMRSEPLRRACKSNCFVCFRNWSLNKSVEPRHSKSTLV